MTKLGVNVDHIATIREARGTPEPDPVAAALLAELAGAQGITVHLREDRRHIKERDVRLLREVVTTRLNLEMAPTDEMVKIACQLLPDTVTLVPEREGEITTEGGLNVVGMAEEINSAIQILHKSGRQVSLFIDPDPEQIQKSASLGARLIEINTAAYAEAVPKGLDQDDKRFQQELEKIVQASQLAKKVGLRVLAGHGLTYRNVGPVSAVPQIFELNIGHNIVARSALVGIKRAVKEMLEVMNSPANNS